MKSRHKRIVRGGIYFCLGLYHLAVNEILGASEFGEKTALCLEISSVVAYLAMLTGIFELATWRKRDRRRVLRSGVRTEGKVVGVSYPFAWSRSTQECASALKITGRSGVYHTLRVKYNQEGVFYEKESWLIRGASRHKIGDQVAICVDRCEPERFYVCE